MIKRLAIACGLMMMLITSTLFAKPHPFESLSGLTRFSASDVLPRIGLRQTPDTVFAIKDVKVGDNVLQQAINLDNKGGELGRIRGGKRSQKINFSFLQPYEETRLEQKIEIYFDKQHGFIQQITATYFLDDAYKSLTPVRHLALSALVEKYGPPLTMQQIYDFGEQTNGEVSLDKFIDSLQTNKPLHPNATEYLLKHNISRSSKWVRGTQDYALLHSGFDRCYLWQRDSFNQVLSFCFFDKTGANASSRGIEVDLHHFPVLEQIKALDKANSPAELSL